MKQQQDLPDSSPSSASSLYWNIPPKRSGGIDSKRIALNSASNKSSEEPMESEASTPSPKTGTLKMCQCCDASAALVETKVELCLPQIRQSKFLCKYHYRINYRMLKGRKSSLSPDSSFASSEHSGVLDFDDEPLSKSLHSQSPLAAAAPSLSGLSPYVFYPSYSVLKENGLNDYKMASS